MSPTSDDKLERIIRSHHELLSVNLGKFLGLLVILLVALCDCLTLFISFLPTWCLWAASKYVQHGIYASLEIHKTLPGPSASLDHLAYAQSCVRGYAR